jgi:hypothetical protein
MNKDNPACYECPEHKSKMHHWLRRDDKTAYCLKCNLELTVEQAEDCFCDLEKSS